MTSGPCSWALQTKTLACQQAKVRHSPRSPRKLCIKKHGFGFAMWPTVYLCHDRTAAFPQRSEFLPASRSAKSNNIYHSRNMSFIHESAFRGRIASLTCSTLTDGLSCRGRGHVERRTGLAFISFYKWTLHILFRPFHFSSHRSHRIGGTLRHLACRPRLICLCQVEIIISSGRQKYWSPSRVPWVAVSSERFGVQQDKIDYTEAEWTLKGFCRTIMWAIKGSWATRG